MKLTRRIITLLLACAMPVTISCGDSSSSSGNDTTTAAETTAAPEEYTYPDVSLNGEKLTILNYAEMWDCNMALDFEEATGEGLNDAIYNRNRKVEEKLGFEMEEVTLKYPGWSQISTIIDMVSQSVMAGDNEYDVAYLPLSFKPGVVTEGYLYDLATLPNMNLDKEWWDKSINDSLLIDGKLYAASSPLQLMSLDMSWVLLFNQELLDDAGKEYPYQLVRDGKWTYDKMAEYAKSVVNLNGDESFAYNKDGNAVYGVARHFDSVSGFIYTADNHLAQLKGDKFEFNMETERLYTTLEKISVLFNNDDGTGVGDSGSAAPYVDIFRAGRSLFVTCELKSVMVLRDMDTAFGLLPFPKFDEAQENYMTSMNTSSCFLTVPSNVQNKEAVGAILDALTYESYKNLIPAYYDVTLSYKGLRNDDSIEMLDIIRNTRGIELSQMFGITNKLQTSLQNLMGKGIVDNAASTIASGKNAVIEAAEKLLETLK